MINNTLFIIFDEKDLKNYLNKNIHVFTLNEFILSEKKKKKVKHFFPDPSKTSLKSEFLSLKVQQVKKEIIEKVKKNNIFKKLNFIDELLDPFLEMKLSSYFYLENIIPNYKKYIFILRKRKYIFTKKSDLILGIFNSYSNYINKKGLLDKFYISRFNLFNNIILKLQEILLNKILKKKQKNKFFISDHKAYFFNELKNKLQNKNSLIYLLSDNFLY